MSIEKTLADLKKRGEGALAAFATAGDPDRETSLDIFRSLGAWGADIIEIGIPYSDPLMDGPVLQRSYTRALKRGFKLDALPAFVEEIGKTSTAPMLIMTCCNPVLRYGALRFFRDVSSAGADSVLITDMPPEEWGESLDLARQFNLGTIFLLAPTTPMSRMQLIDGVSTPFVYCVSKMGVTGAGELDLERLRDYVRFVRDSVSKPVMVGFGISEPEQAKAIGSMADGVVVGSAAVAIIERHLDDRARMFALLEKFIGGLKTALKP